ncbi:kinesin-like protein KIF18A [Dermacentor silvarum]|uniref:kinesin-like protein KIF18A n=1 Tax=Dermacentor silvarum TaxID=543639 RepID=UPI00189A59C8|nr:kinesin-like protein KIF18A [Dermacentor silvarum]
MAVRMRLLSDRDSETTSIVVVVITPAPMVRPTPATSRHPTTDESTMVSPNRKRRSNEAAQSSGTKRRETKKDPPAPGVWVNVAERGRLLSVPDFKTASIVRVLDDRCHVFDLKTKAEFFHFRDGANAKPNEDQMIIFDHFLDETKDNVYVSFALLGSEECYGVVSFVASEFYQRVDKLRSEGQTCDLAVACLEVYNKVVQDLICLDPAKVIAILSLTIHKVKEAGALLELLLKRKKNRSQLATDANAESAWSHPIFQSYATVTENATSMSKETRISMCSVDLAGSEHAAAASRDTKDLIYEGTKLNLSLLALGNCIDPRSKNGTKQVPY